jgi:hypothetical protein
LHPRTPEKEHQVSKVAEGGCFDGVTESAVALIARQDPCPATEEISEDVIA